MIEFYVVIGTIVFGVFAAILTEVVRHQLVHRKERLERELAYRKQVQRLTDKFAAAKQLHFRLESYPDEIEYMLEDARLLQDEMSETIFKMREAVGSGDIEVANRLRLHGESISEQIDAMLALMKQKDTEWGDDREKLDKMLEELKDM